MTKSVSFTLLFTALTAFLVLAPAVPAQSSMQEVYNQAVADFDADKLDEAEAGFQKVLKANPRFVYAKKYLVSIEQKRQNGDGVSVSTKVRAKLAKLQIDEVEFDAAPMQEALTYLSQKSEALSGGTVVPNFIIKGTQDQMQQPVTLRLRGVPLTTVLEYMAQTAQARIDYQEHAVVFTPTTVAGETAQVEKPQSGGGVANTFD